MDPIALKCDLLSTLNPDTLLYKISHNSVFDDHISSILNGDTHSFTRGDDRVRYSAASFFGTFPS
jgi:hypothetical protein